MALKDFVRSGGIKTEYPSVKDLITKGKAEGWDLKRSKSTGSIILKSKAGKNQLVFTLGDDTIYVRVSDNALDAIVAGEKPMSLPVYNMELHEDGDAKKAVIGKMLVIGIKASGNADWESVPAADLETAFVVTTV